MEGICTDYTEWLLCMMNTGKVLRDPLWMHVVLLMGSLPEVKELSVPMRSSQGSLSIIPWYIISWRIFVRTSPDLGYVYTHSPLFYLLFILPWIIFHQPVLFSNLFLVYHMHVLYLPGASLKKDHCNYRMTARSQSGGRRGMGHLNT